MRRIFASASKNHGARAKRGYAVRNKALMSVENAATGFTMAGQGCRQEQVFRRSSGFYCDFACSGRASGIKKQY
jgi:hypothetical protein